MRLAALLITAALLLTGCGGTNGGTNGESSPGHQESPDAARLSSGSSYAVVVAEGDIACPPSLRPSGQNCRQGATGRLARAMRPDAVIGLGDLQYQRGSTYQFTHSYARTGWGAMRGITWPVPGNHEYYTRGAAGYYRYFQGRQPGAPGYYRRALNGWQIYLLNSNCDQISCAREQRWLDTQMTRHPAKCQMIAMHHPRYSSGGEHGNSPWAVGFWRVALKHRADVALAGHDHDYERFAPKDNAGHVVASGMQSFVSGAGGRNLYAKGTRKNGSLKFVNDRHGVLRLALRPGSITWQYFDLSGRVIDKGWRACR